MKSMKKLLAVALVLVMLVALGATAFAAGDGSITIKNATKGQTYTAYKVFDATVNGDAVSYKTPAANASKLDNTLFGWSTAADSDGNITVWKLDTASESDITDWIEANYAEFGGTAITGVFDSTNSTVTFSNLDYGYYYIESTLGATVTIDSAAPTATVYDKNEVEPTDPVKTIVSVDGEEQNEVTEANAHVGSVVGFKVTANAVNWTGSEDQAVITKEWKLTDNPKNMTIDQSTLVVKFNGVELTKGTDYTVADPLTITVPMVDSDGNSIFEAKEENDGLIPIEITYSATITEAAAGAPAENEVGGPPVKLYTYAFQVAKTDGTDPLPGAQFELWSAKGGTGAAAALTFKDNGDGTYTYDAAGTVTTLDMTTNTTIVIKGLDNKWSYTLKEITVPEGYNQAEDVDIAGSDLTKVEENTDTTITSTALYKETVENKKGAELPSTGGIGTTLFYVIGSVLFLGAAVVLVTKRRVHE